MLTQILIISGNQVVVCIGDYFRSPEIVEIFKWKKAPMSEILLFQDYPRGPVVAPKDQAPIFRISLNQQIWTGQFLAFG